MGRLVYLGGVQVRCGDKEPRRAATLTYFAIATNDAAPMRILRLIYAKPTLNSVYLYFVRTADIPQFVPALAEYFAIRDATFDFEYAGELELISALPTRR